MAVSLPTVNLKANSNSQDMVQMAFEGINNAIRCFLQREANTTIKLFVLPRSFKTKHTGLGLNMKVWRIWLFFCCFTRQVIHLLLHYKRVGWVGLLRGCSGPNMSMYPFSVKVPCGYNNVLQKEVSNSVTSHLIGKNKGRKQNHGVGGAMGRLWLT